MRYNSESLEIKDLRSRNDVLYKDIKNSLGLLITVFENFLENTKRFSPKKYTTFIDSQ